MPGPTLRLAAFVGDSNDFSVFESCDDMQEAWGGGGLNGNFSAESIYHECNTQDEMQQRDVRINGDPATHSIVKLKIPEYSRRAAVMAEPRPINTASAGLESVVEVHTTRVSQVEGYVEDMEVEDETAEEAVEAMNLPVVSASLSVDLTTSLTRQKISSVQRGPTLTYADHDDVEESPTRRPHPPIHANDSIDVGTPPHLLRSTPTSPTSPTSSPSPQSKQVVPVSPTFVQRPTRVSRNPSYHFAVREAAISTPKNTSNPHMLEKGSRSCDSSPIRPQMEPLREESPVDGKGQRRHVSESEYLITIPLAVNMPRSVSFSGQELLSPTSAASGSLSEGNSRSGSVPQLSATPAHSTSAPTLETKSPPPNFTRGSVISRSFRRLFSTPSRPPPAIQPEECWDDIPGVHHTPEAEVKSSRLRRISSSFSRKLTTKPKMSGSSGTNGQHIMPNGTTSPEDARSLVEYEDLLKLFCCSGCQNFMAPPLHQCRKGHLVCNSCRFSLKQACPTCKQRFSESTNMMMEQVCQLVKFPCKYAAQGCPEFHRPRAKQDHEHFCSYRPVHCHHGPQGCPKVLLLRDMQQHLEQCEFKK